jgi:hypothetical protein
MLWSQVISLWESGHALSYPESIKKRFFYETYPCDANFTNQYVSKFIESSELNQIKTQDYTDFATNISCAIARAKKGGAYATSFLNKSGNALLVIPLPVPGKNYGTIKDFIDNAPGIQQSEFWKLVAQEVKSVLKSHDKVWISTHGLGVSYFHLRIDLSPKYYVTKQFKL